MPRKSKLNTREGWSGMSEPCLQKLSAGKPKWKARGTASSDSPTRGTRDTPQSSYSAFRISTGLTNAALIAS